MIEPPKGLELLVLTNLFLLTILLQLRTRQGTDAYDGRQTNGPDASLDLGLPRRARDL